MSPHEQWLHEFLMRNDRYYNHLFWSMSDVTREINDRIMARMRQEIDEVFALNGSF